MKKLLVIFIITLVAIGVSWKIFSRLNKNAAKKPVETVFIAPKEYTESFEKSTASARLFYEKYRRALDQLKHENYQEAIQSFNECVPEAGIGIEKGMVYNRLVQIYKALDDPQNELKYTELTIKFSANTVLNEELSRRAAELRQLLSAKEAQKK